MLINTLRILSISVCLSLLISEQVVATSNIEVNPPSGKLTINLTDFNNNTGEARIAVFNSKAQFLKTPCQAVTVNIVSRKTSNAFINIPYGEYAIAVFHDENINGKLDTNFLGMPQEQYGFSNNAKGFMGPPGYDNAKFNLNKSAMTVTINLQ